ncbi:GNAT family N-acetyltransferase [Micromonospora sp. NPDC003197]
MTRTSHDEAGPTRTAGEVLVVQRVLDHPDAASLLRSFYEDQVERYGFADPVDADPAEYVLPSGVFVVAYCDGVPAGCGGYRWFDRPSGTVEIKKTYSVPRMRGLGVGRALLVWLERHAVAAGARRGILETGVRNHAAIRLFHEFGYRSIESYVPSRDPEINRAFTKLLA